VRARAFRLRHLRCSCSWPKIIWSLLVHPAEYITYLRHLQIAGWARCYQHRVPPGLMTHPTKHHVPTALADRGVGTLLPTSRPSGTSAHHWTGDMVVRLAITFEREQPSTLNRSKPQQKVRFQPVIQPISLPSRPICASRTCPVVKKGSSRRDTVGKQNPPVQCPLGSGYK
jgi:hypothetical protein